MRGARLAVPLVALLALASPVSAAGWNPPVMIGTSSNGVAWMNSIAVTGDGTAVAVWQDPAGIYGYRAVFLSRSTTSGASWTSATQMSDPDACVAGGPAVSANGSNVDIAWAEFHADTCTPPPAVGAVWYAHSSDNGKTFSAAKRLSPTSGFAGVLDIASSDDGQVLIGWTDDGNAKMYVRTSTDWGANFAPAQMIGVTRAYPYEIRPDQPDGSVTVAIGDGVAYVGYLSSQSTVKVRRSTDSGATWSLPIKIASNADGFSEIDVAADGARAVLAYAATNGKTDWARYRETNNSGATWPGSVNLTTRQQPAAWYTAISLSGGTLRSAYTRCVTPACDRQAVYYRQRVGSKPLSSPVRVSESNDYVQAAYAAGVTASNGKPIVVYFYDNGLGTFVEARSQR